MIYIYDIHIYIYIYIYTYIVKLPSFLLHCPTFMTSAGVSMFRPTRRAVQPSSQWREGRGAKVEKQAADRDQQWSGKAAFRVKDSHW